MIHLCSPSPLLCWLLACSIVLNFFSVIYIFSRDLKPPVTAPISHLKILDFIPSAPRRHSERLIIIVTPTYDRLVQKAELVRQVHTFQLVPPALHWIVVEDADSTSVKVGNLLAQSGLNYTLLAVPTPDIHLRDKDDRREWIKPRGVAQRNLGIEFLRRNDTVLSRASDAVVYFADDDNTYSVDLFTEMRKMVRQVAVWPVAFVGGLIVERPLVESGNVVGWNAVFRPERPFALDMAGFAISLQHLRAQTRADFPLDAPIGHQETKFIQSLGIYNLDQIEPLADLCRKVLVWHTKTQEVPLWAERRLEMRAESSLHANMTGDV